jgi:hypothetical protein
MKRIPFILIIGIILSSGLYSQSHLSIDINDPVYMLLEIATIKGAIDRLPAAKPYSKSTIIAYLQSALSNGGNLSDSDKEIISRSLGQLRDADKLFFRPEFSDKGPLGDFAAGLNEESEVDLNFNKLSSWNMYNAIRFFIRGDISDFFSYYGCFGGTYDKVGTESFAPYAFTKKWDGFHIGFSTPRYSSTGEEQYPYFSFILEDEATAQFFDDNLTLSFSRYRRDWGEGEGNLYLSKTARPYQGLDIHSRFASWCNLSWTAGTLNDWQKENALTGNALSYQKMLTVQMIEFFPADWLYLSSVATAVWGKRFELTYLCPLLYPVIAQNTIGDFDNVSQSVNLMFFIPGYAKFYFSFLADEMELISFENFFTRPRNMVAYQAGMKIAVPWVPATLITLQYTKIEPFVYAHYPESTIEPLGHPVDMSYTNDGENLGFHTPPNSDEILLKADTFAIPDFLVSFAYRLIRHGTNDGDPTTVHLIYGSVNDWFDYNNADSYPNKNFLNDGFYDWNNIISIGARYMLPKYYLTLSLEYTFAYTFWVSNSSGKPAPSDQVGNIVSISVSYSR